MSGGSQIFPHTHSVTSGRIVLTVVIIPPTTGFLVGPTVLIETSHYVEILSFMYSISLLIDIKQKLLIPLIPKYIAVYRDK